MLAHELSGQCGKAITASRHEHHGLAAMGELTGKFFAEPRGGTGDQQAGNVFHGE
jgi:hypothetical protein